MYMRNDTATTAKGVETMTALDRTDNGKLRAIAWPGGYSILYLMGDGETIPPAHHHSARALIRGPRVNRQKNARP